MHKKRFFAEIWARGSPSKNPSNYFFTHFSFLALQTRTRKPTAELTSTTQVNSATIPESPTTETATIEDILHSLAGVDTVKDTRDTRNSITVVGIIILPVIMPATIPDTIPAPIPANITGITVAMAITVAITTVGTRDITEDRLREGITMICHKGTTRTGGTRETELIVE